jgi:hypothetical protein
MSPSISVVKTLFALSGNTCAYDGCETKLTDPVRKQVNADVAHICGDKPGAPQYDPSMTDAERDDFENLILLCPGHHRLVDGLEPDRHTVETLRGMKHRHESRWERAWAPEEALLRYAALAVVRPPTIEAPAHVYPPTVSTGVPRLVAERDTGDAVELVNTGNADAYGITVEPLPGMGGAWVPVGEIPPGRISPWCSLAGRDPRPFVGGCRSVRPAADVAGCDWTDV